MDNYLVSKIKVGISACQYGAKVRYDGKGWDMTEHLKREKNEFIWYPMCPELQSGLGVPRVSISLRGGNGDDFWEGNANIKNRDGVLLNDKVKKGALTCFEQLKEENIEWKIVDIPTMSGNPRHPLYQKSESKLSLFNMENYIENVAKKKIKGKKYEIVTINNVEFK